MSKVDVSAATPAKAPESDMGEQRPDVDAPLVERFVAGDQEVFSELVARHSRMVYRIARSASGDHAEADDLTQEIFLRAWRYLPKFRRDASFKTWLRRVAVTTALNYKRRWSNWRGLVPLEGSSIESDSDRFQETAPEPRAGAGDDPHELAVAEELGRAVRDGLEKLPPRQRLALTLRTEQGLSCEEIATSMGCSVGAVKAHIFHALRKLRTELGPEYEKSKRQSTGGGTQ